MHEHELTLSWQRSGRNASLVIQAKLGDRVLHCDTFDPRRASQRDRFLDRLCIECEAVDRISAQDALLGIVDQANVALAKDLGGPAEEDPYQVVDGRICRRIEVSQGTVSDVPLCNFSARIIEEVIRDDGLEQNRRLALEGSLTSGEALPRVEVPTEDFGWSDWVLKQWGAAAVVYAGQGVRDHLRAALQILSGQVARRVIHTAIGWVQIDSQWGYLHAAGAIGPDGPVPGVQVELPESLSKFRLPEPPTGLAMQEAVRSFVGLTRGLAPDRVVLPLLLTTIRAVLPGSSYSGHVFGRTGVFKTELVALFQRSFGPEMDPGNLPASWSSTANAIEAIAFSARDALLVVDDFAPNGTASDIQRFHREADRIFRAQGNRSGRQRLRADGMFRPVKHPRGMILSTGEEVPRGHSIQARLLVVEVKPGDVDVGQLTSCQALAASGIYAAAMAAYLRWLAPRYDRVREEVLELSKQTRSELTSSDQHRRTPSIVADLLAGLQLFLRFVRDTGAIDEASLDDLAARCRKSLGELAEEQAAHQEAADPTGRYLLLLASVLSTGRAHLANHKGLPPSRSKQACGWRPDGDPESESCSWQPQGPRVGWIHDDDVYLDPEACFAEVQRFAAMQNETLVVGRETLHRRLNERGLLASTDVKRQRLLVRRSLEGARRGVLHLHAQHLASLQDGGPSDPCEPDDESPAENRATWWGAVDHSHENRPTQPSHRAWGKPDPGAGQGGQPPRSPGPGPAVRISEDGRFEEARL